MYSQDGRTNFTQISAESTLDEVLSTFEDFLRGSGFHFDGTLGFVNEGKIDINIEGATKENGCWNCMYISLDSEDDPCCDCVNGQSGNHAFYWMPK